MEGLGKLFNVIPTADAAWVNLQDYEGVTFICIGADTYTIQEAKTNAGGSSQNLTAISSHYTNSAAVGATKWVNVVDSPVVNNVTLAANGAIYIGAPSLSAGYKYVRCSSTAAGLVVAIAHDLKVLRSADLLNALAV